MIQIVIAVFIIGYLAITLEHPIKINKTASALLTGILIWIIFAIFGGHNISEVNSELSEHLAEISEILFFLLGAMTIVELIDAHNGFEVITERITTKNKTTLLWIIVIFTFFLSAVLDNLTTSIVMVSLLRKMVKVNLDRKLFIGAVIISANAGGAWSPMGDVTTTMLWIGGQISAPTVVTKVLFPSLISAIVPILLLSLHMKGNIDTKQPKAHIGRLHGSRRMLFSGITALVFVPVFKTLTHLPPYMGMLLGLGLVWVVSEIIHSDKDEEERKPFTAAHALSRIDTSSILFFLGILIAVAGLQSMHILNDLAAWLEKSAGNMDLVVFIIGLISSIFDNVPLVAGTMGMYDLTQYPIDSRLWIFLAYCAGTGGSILIIGSAAGVAVMGMEKIEFFWYIKRISLYALIGYICGAITFLLTSNI